MNHRWAVRAAIIIIAAAIVGCVGLSKARSAQYARYLAMSPAYSDPVPTQHVETATFAAGCFWSMQAIFGQLKGVERAAPGYAGGTVPNPTYQEVENGRTGHAETVNITFDPSVISYRTLLQVLLTTRDPTTLNRQGPDQGTNYRSVIFYHDAEQRKEAREAIAAITAAHVWPDPIVTQLVPFSKFYPAEEYHWNYYWLHPNEPYCQYVIAPEIAKFQAEYPKLLQK
jgi:peptide-methionine (S)-S-oxide reductase